MMQSQDRETLFATLPSPWPDDVLPAIQQSVHRTNRSVVVLDDDPTGTQTVYDIPVLTTWDVAELTEILRAGTPLCYILTNSRSMVTVQAQALATEIGRNLQAAAQATGRRFSVISRSDSTLRGHYPAEVDPLLTALGKQEAIHLIAPFFEEGGRYTINDIHWVQEDDTLPPTCASGLLRTPTAACLRIESHH
ncbi:MAG: four-carbon acid sugar kinase family protein [Bacteroidota bacterium]